MKKKRKPRGFKLNGQKSLDMCSCGAFHCDPMAMSDAFNEKIRRRRKNNVCIACGHNPCKCKSSL